MLCTYCKREFDEKLNIPRLLILCGHSLCETCCYRLHLNNRVECPECRASTFIESISLLPKNLALIAHHSNSELCGKHHKKYQGTTLWIPAFCYKENVLICIDCILQDGHKNHQMDGIINCYQRMKEQWEGKMDKICKYGDKMEELLEENRGNQDDFENSYRTTTEIVTNFFKEVRDIIAKEEEALQLKFRQLYTLNTAKYAEKNLTLNSHIEALQMTINNFSRYENLTHVEFLESFASRESMYNSINQTPEEPFKSPSFLYSKKAILETITKNLQGLIAEKQEKQEKNEKNEKKPSAVSINNYSSNYSNSSQFKKINDTPLIKAVRKAPAQNPSSINLSSKKKISAKKDITAASLSTPVSQNAPTPLSNKSNSSTKEKEGKCSLNIKSEISAVDPKESLCHSFLSNMTSFLGERKSIYLVGGFNEEANNIVKLNLFSWQWEEVSPLPTNRSKFGSIAIDQQIYLFGGKKGKERVNDSEIYNIVTNKWGRSEVMGKNRSGFAIVQVAHLLYFIGGNDGQSILNSVQTLSITTGEWRKIQSMNEPRDQLAVVVGKNNRIYAIGGFGGVNNEPLRSVQVYDPRIQKWKLLPSMNEPRRALAAAVLADGIYAIGGFDGSNYMSSVEKFEEGDKEWTYVAAMKQARCTHSAVSIFESQEILVFGGFDFVPLDSVEKYNVISNEWESVCKMPTPRFMHSSLLLKED